MIPEQIHKIIANVRAGVSECPHGIWDDAKVLAAEVEWLQERVQVGDALAEVVRLAPFEQRVKDLEAENERLVEILADHDQKNCEDVLQLEAENRKLRELLKRVMDNLWAIQSLDVWVALKSEIRAVLAETVQP